MKLKNIVLAITLTLSLLFSSVSFSQIINEMKWHPGHYIMLVGDNKDVARYIDPVYKELETHGFRGIAIRYKWSELETSKGVYNFASIDKQLAGVASRNKNLIILLETKSFTTEIKVPKYLQTAEYEGGIFLLEKNNKPEGSNLKLWNIKVRDRLMALSTALGKHLNTNPNFEGFGLQETALGNPLNPLTVTQANGYYTNLIAVDKKIRQSFPNTMTYQLTNYPRSELNYIISEIKAMGAGVGATDIFLQEPGLFIKGTKNTSDGLYLRFPALHNQIPLLAQVEKSNYENTRYDGKGYVPTVTEILNFARDTLKVNYILWTRSPGYFDDVLLVMKQKQQTSTASGGLNPVCPIVILICK
jgi:hypothetical protein